MIRIASFDHRQTRNSPFFRTLSRDLVNRTKTMVVQTRCQKWKERDEISKVANFEKIGNLANFIILFPFLTYISYHHLHA